MGPVCEVVKKTSTFTAVVEDGKQRSSSLTAAVMKKKKKKMRKKKKKEEINRMTKCHTCLHEVKIKNLDKHMHKCARNPNLHHKAIHRLKDGKQTHQEKLTNKTKERKLQTEESAPAGSRAANSSRSVKNSDACLSNYENTLQSTNARAVRVSVSEKGSQTEARCWETSESFRRSQTKDQLTQTDSISSKKEGKWRQSGEQDKVVPGQKRPCDANTSDFPPVKKLCLGTFSSVHPRFPPSGPKQDLTSRIPTNIRTSPNEDGLRRRTLKVPDPELKLGAMRSDITPSYFWPPQMSSKKSQECKPQTCKIRRTLPPCNLPTSAGTDPQDTLGHTPESGSRKVLPSLLSQSLSRKEDGKPDLKTARGIRTTRTPGQGTNTGGVKPAPQKLISTKSSLWRGNWNEMHQEVTHRKLQEEKDTPRFGIEQVTPLPPDPQEGDLEHFELDEGFHWASIVCDSTTAPALSEDAARKHCRSSSTDHLMASGPEQEKKTDIRRNPVALETSRSSESVVNRLESSDLNDNALETQVSEKQPNAASLESVVSEKQPNAASLESVVCVTVEKMNECPSETTLQKRTYDGLQSIPDTRVKQETQDVPHDDTLNNNLPKSQVKDLLSVSLREVELSSSLEDVESRLLLAQAALQTAFQEFQRLQMNRLQVTTEMSSFRQKRINILKRLKNSAVGTQTRDAETEPNA